ncbi:hypothetical protein VTK73DRAFT_8543 [Phialemonium thermophilum]|uniref:Uncharacterized protein n=1 Tax=Phialemonium thermophilum TaxID=223376 RepID=A0ABR3W7T9_9PEZI
MTQGILHPAGYAADTLFDELSRQLSTFDSRRLSLSNARAHNTSRIVKPRSANNSPKTSAAQKRRRMAMHGDYGVSSQTAALPNHLPSVGNLGPGIHGDAASPPTYFYRPTRPISWHPLPSQLAQAQFDMALPNLHTQYLQYHQPQQPMQLEPQPHEYSTQSWIGHDTSPYEGPDGLDVYQGQLPPTPAVYSGFASPASTFSPLSLAPSVLDGPEQQAQHTFKTADWMLSSGGQPLDSAPMGDVPIETANLQPEVERTQGTGTSAAGWQLMGAPVFDPRSAPPTPQDIGLSQLEPKFRSDESIPFEPLQDEQTEGGEVLYGMGLYDTPEKPVVGSQLPHSHSTTSLFSCACTYTEPTGKGLKLEDAWEPPAMDDEDSDQEGDAEEEQTQDA